RIGERKQRRTNELSNAHRDKLQGLLAAFNFVRPLLYTQNDRCLLDSLTLINFLATYGFFPNLVFGINTRPFVAHAWVQDGNNCLNYPADYVRSFSPILVV